jgi:ABC-type lipoprotein release transport system permease subunit
MPVRTLRVQSVTARHARVVSTQSVGTRKKKNNVNPLSPLTYYRRHKRAALLLLVLIGSLTLGVFFMVGVMSTGSESTFYRYYYLTRLSRIVAGQALDPGSVAQLRAHLDVAAVLPENGLNVNFPAYGGVHSRPLLGVTEADLPLVMETCDLRLKEGRLIGPRAAEVILSQEIIRALGLKIGDRIGHDINKNYYPAIVTELTLVGVLESIPSEAGPAIQAGFVSYEYLEGHEAYQPRLFNLLIIPRQGRRVAVNDFAATLTNRGDATTSVRLETFEGETEEWRQVGKAISAIYTLADVIMAVAAALVVGMVNQTVIAHRLPELGLLHAVGHEKRRLVRRLVLEMGLIVGVGWGLGLLLSVALSLVMNTTPFAAGGPAIDLVSPVPFLFTLPIPLAVVSWVGFGVNRVLSQLDTIAIVERGKLSMEEAGGKPLRSAAKAGRRGAAPSTLNPLSSWAFYLRHRRQGLALLLSTGLMVLGVAFPAFVTTMMTDATWPLLISYSSHASIVSPAATYQAVDPAVLAQIRTQPGVAHVIPVKALSMMVNAIPAQSPLPIYAVREQDLQTLLDLYGLHVGEGEMIQPRSGQIVLTRALARNRGLGVGDAVGRPVNKMDGIPTALTVVGLLDPNAPGLAQREGYHIPTAPRWVGFASYEFVEDHEQYSAAPMQTLVIPVEGHAAEVETWLEESIASPRVTVETLGTRYRYVQDFLRIALPLLAITESIVAVVAAVALAILNIIFFTQRQDEFGILHAVGYSRAGLIARTWRESASIAGLAWLIGAACCLALVLGAQAIVFVPKGMSLDLTNTIPWLFTLPIPLAIVTASASTIGWALSRLDPVAIIERRA